ncbi:poly-gamma-glutamate synthesis protein (capsule biosynthesis protein) [Caloramator quimbayensis]|uniref:Poly-gamma-glutamate synthesis protein (Capsule biosynthesis protein) n=1 Tax=Caloramator quimbayensis TaxID=1147123 RepID=A0A1T4WK94_9CLOT|nr:CapA family protein [Caloramator quimbayensis]SKA77744.1 poly-gamma-glutamate synthesis protein (capsule biosynthesis protein) [Caloramator quimbayensis]
MIKRRIIILTIFVFLFCFFTVKGEDNESKEENAQKNDTTITQVAEDKNKDEVEIIISAAGDCSLGRDEKSPYIYSFDDEFIKQKRDYSYFFKNVKDIFEKDDLTIINLEGPLTNEKNRVDKKFSFKGALEYAKILKQGSIEAVNVANNHTFDYGNKGFIDTINSLKKEEIIYFGMDYKVLRNIKGVNIGLLGYKAWSYDSYIKKKIKNDIKYLKSKGAQLIIVSFHWGDEGKYYPNNIQKSLAKYTIDSGADLILGHHPHVIQGISAYKGKNIVYSLGNFCFGGNKNPKDKDSFIYQQTFKFSDGKLLDKNYKVIPVSISSLNYRNNYQPTPLKGSEEQRVLNKIKYYSKIK